MSGREHLPVLWGPKFTHWAGEGQRSQKQAPDSETAVQWTREWRTVGKGD